MVARPDGCPRRRAARAATGQSGSTGRAASRPGSPDPVEAPERGQRVLDAAQATGPEKDRSPDIPVTPGPPPILHAERRRDLHHLHHAGSHRPGSGFDERTRELTCGNSRREARSSVAADSAQQRLAGAIPVVVTTTGGPRLPSARSSRARFSVSVVPKKWTRSGCHRRNRPHRRERRSSSDDSRCRICPPERDRTTPRADGTSS